MVVSPVEKHVVVNRDASDVVFMASQTLPPSLVTPLAALEGADALDAANPPSGRYLHTNGAIAQVALNFPGAYERTSQGDATAQQVTILSFERSAAAAAGAEPEPWTAGASQQQTARYRKRPSRSLYLAKSGQLATVTQDEVSAGQGRRLRAGD